VARRWGAGIAGRFCPGQARAIARTWFRRGSASASAAGKRLSVARADDQRPTTAFVTYFVKAAKTEISFYDISFKFFVGNTRLPVEDRQGRLVFTLFVSRFGMKNTIGEWRGSRLSTFSSLVPKPRDSRAEMRRRGVSNSTPPRTWLRISCQRPRALLLLSKIRNKPSAPPGESGWPFHVKAGTIARPADGQRSRRAGPTTCMASCRSSGRKAIVWKRIFSGQQLGPGG